MDISKEQIKIIHTIKNKYGITNQEYENILNEEFGAISCKELSKTQADKLIHKLNYENSLEYKYGYDQAFDDMLQYTNLETMFFNKFATNRLELEMFKMLSNEDKLKILKSQY